MRHRAGIILACLVCVAPAPLIAHQGHHDSSLRLLLKPDGLHVSVRYSLPAGPRAQQARMNWDENGDGRIDGGEIAAALDGVQSEFGAGLIVQVDGVLVKARTLRRDQAGMLGPARSDGTLWVSIQLVFDFGPGPELRRLELRCSGAKGDRHVPADFQPGRGIALGVHNGHAQRRGGKVLVRFALHATRALRVSFRCTSKAE